MTSKVVEAARAAFPASATAITLGAVVYEGVCHPEPLVAAPIAMMNRHGLIAGATGTGKTRTLQLLAEQLSARGVPVFVSDVKGDLSGMGAAGDLNDRVGGRAQETGYPWKPFAAPVEFLSLSGKRGAQLRATVSSFGPLLLSKVLGLNETQTSVLTLVFEFCDDRGLALLDFADLRAVLQHLTGDGAAELADYGGMSKQTVGVLLREMVELEHQGAESFFGEPQLDLDDLMVLTPEGGGLVSVLELADVQDKPALSSTFLMWLLARLYAELPEVGDLEKPKLVFLFDEAHLLFDGASKEFRAEVEKVVRLIRSKGIGVFFITQNPKDIPDEILGQLGHRVQHALRAFTPDDEKALRAAARTYPKTEFYDVAATLTSLGIGEAFVTVLTERGTPTPPFATRMVPPGSRMAPMEENEFAARLAASAQVREYATALDRVSAREMLAGRETVAVGTGDEPREAPDVPAAPPRRAAKEPPNTFEQILKSPMANTIVRGVMGALLGTTVRRRRRRYY